MRKWFGAAQYVLFGREGTIAPLVRHEFADIICAVV
jgi:hypothetical protein